MARSNQEKADFIFLILPKRSSYYEEQHSLQESLLDIHFGNCLHKIIQTLHSLKGHHYILACDDNHHDLKWPVATMSLTFIILSLVVLLP